VGNLLLEFVFYKKKNLQEKTEQKEKTKETPPQVWFGLG
jgi:hypothetical protein